VVTVDLTNEWDCFVELIHKTRDHQEGDRIVTGRIELTSTTPTFGGCRWWFLCPRTGSRTTKLFLPNGGWHFWGRQAYRLGYACQREDRFSRLQRRAAALNRQLGGEGGSTWDIPPAKPKRMRWRTYERKYERWEGVVQKANEEFTTRRHAGKVVHEHLASLGAIVVPPSVADRATFWQKLHERLAKLSNRIDAETQAKILGAVHDRVPMVTIEEIRELQLANAEAEERYWSQLQGMNETSAAEHTALRRSVDSKIAGLQAGAIGAKAAAAAAKDRAARLKRGEAVAGGLTKPMTLEEAMTAIGWTTSDLQHANRMQLIDEAGMTEELLDNLHSRRRAKAASLALLKRLVAEGRVNLDPE
jgi:hypothetical protein